MDAGEYAPHIVMPDRSRRRFQAPPMLLQKSDAPHGPNDF